MRYGAFCEECQGIEKCKDKPSQAEPITDECPACNGADGGCDECNGTGQWNIEACPLTMLDDEILMMARYIDLFKKGLPPVAGGTLNQTAVFVEAALYFWQEEKAWKKKLGIIDG